MTILFLSFIRITLFAQSTAELTLSLDGDGDSGNFLFDASDLGSGIYFYQLKSNQFSDIKKCVLIK